MSKVVDTCVLLDILDGDSDFSTTSAVALNRHVREGLIIAPISYVELAPAFLGDKANQDEFLSRIDVHLPPFFDRTALYRAHFAWYRHIAAKRNGLAVKRPIADILIGALAVEYGGLITRNPKDFSSLYPDLEIIVP